MLLEAKWTKNPMPASSLYQFKGKIDGKLAGTLGLFTAQTSTDVVRQNDNRGHRVQQHR